MSTTFDEELDVKQIHPHPANPRHSAKADEEMVASIKSKGLYQPLIVAPGPDGNGFRVIDGHRRLDGVKKARLKTVPAVIRADLLTDADQLEAAVITSVNSEKLTAIEEAEAFEVLRDTAKWTQKKIAERTGRSPALVSGRLKLLRLSKKTRQSIHQGQLSFDDALELVAFEDDPKTQAALAKDAGGPAFPYALERAKRRRTQQAAIDQKVAEYTKAKVPEFTLPKGKHDWQVEQEGEAVRLYRTFSQAPQDHKKCLAYLLTSDTWQGPGVELWCTEPGSHADKLSEAEQERRTEDARLRAERDQRAEAEEISRTLRITAVTGLIGDGVKVSPELADIIRALLPSLIWGLDDSRLDVYATVMGIEPADRWQKNTYQRKAGDQAKIGAHCTNITAGSTAYIARALVGVLLATSEQSLGVDPSSSWNPLAAAYADRYLQLLTGIGHTFTEIDEEYQALATTPDPYGYIHAKGSAGPGTETRCGLRATVGKSLRTHEDVAKVTCPGCTEAVAS